MKEKDRSTQQFFIGIIADEQFKELALAVLPELEDRLNAEIDLRSYTDEIEQIYFTPVLTLDEQEIEEVSYDAGEKRLCLRGRVHIDFGEKFDEDEFLRLVSRTLFEIIEKSAKISRELFDQISRTLNFEE